MTHLRTIVMSLALLTGATACSAATLGTVIKTAQDIWGVIQKTREFVEPLVTKERIERVDDVIKNEDLPGAMRELSALLRELRAQGHDVPEHITADMLYAYEVVGGMQEGLRALHAPSTPEMTECAKDEDCA